MTTEVRQRLRHLCVLGCLLGSATGVSAQVVVFSETFDTAVPTAIAPGVALRAGVQGYAGLGPAGNQFGGSFLRSPTGNTVTLTLSGLPAHSSISIEFLFAAIDSLDGTGTFPQGDFFNVTLDGVSFFRESFANATAQQVQSYLPPPGVQLARRVDLGFSGPGGYYTDSAYNMAVEPRFHMLPHTGATAVFTFLIEGPGIQSLADESWAMDNLRVLLSPSCGSADFDGDGDVGTDADIEAFFACLGGNCCTACGSADFDGDGDTGTDADIEAFFRVLGGGNC
jgi:hypothetical protein